MTSSRVAKRYARALLELAAEQNQLEPWGVELARLAQIVSAPEVLTRLTSPEISQLSRIEAMSAIAERLNLSFPLRSFAVVLARHRRIDQMAAASDAYQSLLDERLGRARATLIFAAPPADAEKDRVVAALEALSGKRILPTIRIERALLGGVIAELEGKTYDASLATRLQAAERHLSE
jgi:F-type H+-transporting ATPase subunit delta